MFALIGGTDLLDPELALEKRGALGQAHDRGAVAASGDVPWMNEVARESADDGDASENSVDHFGHRVFLSNGKSGRAACGWEHVIVSAPDRAHALTTDGTQLAFLRNAGEGFRLWVLEDGEERNIPVPEGWQVREIAWGPDGLVASVGNGGLLDLYLLGSGEPRRLTTSGAAMAPEPVGDDLYHLELHARGYRIHRQDREAAQHPDPEPAVGLALRPATPDTPPFALAPTESRPMRLGRLEPRVLVSGMVGEYKSEYARLKARNAP